MSREIKRVALDFDWKMNKVWKGYMSPEDLQGEKCAECDGSGQTDSAWWLQHYSYRFQMLLDDFTMNQPLDRRPHPYFTEDPYPHGTWEKGPHGNREFTVRRPSGDIQELMNGLAENIGRDHSDYYTVFHALIKASGVEKWGVCKPCKGTGRLEQHDGQFSQRDAWEPFEPPAGDGWQVWETVSEGSPVSPVFSTQEALIEWLTSENYRTGIHIPLTIEEAERFVENAWAPTFISTPEKGLVTGDRM